jgi:hypothetical protein
VSGEDKAKAVQMGRPSIKKWFETKDRVWHNLSLESAIKRIQETALPLFADLDWTGGVEASLDMGCLWFNALKIAEKK